MDAEITIRARRRGRRRLAGLAVLFVSLPLLVFGASNLLLSTPWLRSWAASKLEKRTGLPAQIGGISWSPWNGATARNVVILQPEPLRAAVSEPLLSVAAIQIFPVWKAWLRGSLEVHSVRVSSPRLVLSVEMLAHLAARSGTPSVPVSPSRSPVAAEPAPEAPTAASPPEPPGIASPVPAAAAVPTGWLHLTDASLSIVSAGPIGSLLEIIGVRGAIPCSGDSARSFVYVDSVRALSAIMMREATLPISWQPPFLQLDPTQMVVAGKNVEILARLGRLSGIPLQMAARMAAQPLPEFEWPAGIKASASSVAAEARFGGLMMAPASWQGDWVAEAKSPTVSAAGGQHAFERASMIAALRGGVLTCTDARLTSDALSLLGNATLFPDGRFAVAGRSVASLDDTLQTIRRIFPAAGETLALTPLSTPQRVAFDVEYFGDFPQSYLRLGREGPLIDLKQTSSP